MDLDPILDAAHSFAGAVLFPGDVAVDATTGNGHDTVFLAKQVGESGRVYGFDVQPEALRATTQRLDAAGVAARVTLRSTGHEHLRRCLPKADHGDVGAVVFNCGYLPGGDQEIVTRPETTVAALRASLDMVRPGGRVVVVLYLGHDGGEEEARAVREWARGLDQERAQALSYRFVNQIHHPPRLLVMEKCGIENRPPTRDGPPT